MIVRPFTGRRHYTSKCHFIGNGIHPCHLSCIYIGKYKLSVLDLVNNCYGYLVHDLLGLFCVSHCSQSHSVSANKTNVIMY